MNEKIS